MGTLANSEDPDEIPYNVSFHHDLHYLQRLKKKFIDRSKAVLLLEIIFVIYVSCLSCFLVCSLQPGKGLASWLSCMYVLLCFYHFPMWCPGSGLPSSLLYYLIVLVPDICLLTYFREINYQS